MADDLDIPDLGDVAPVSSKRFADTAVKRTALSQKEAALSQNEGELALAREKGLAGPRADLAATAGAEIPYSPTMQPTPEPPTGPIIDPEKFKDFGKIAFPFVMLLGKAMRADGVQALNALSSSMRGYREGREKESAHQFEQFKAKMQKTVADNKQKLEEYRGILARRDMDMQQKMQLLEIAAQKYDDAGTYYATQRKSLADIHKHLDQEDNATAKIAAAEIGISALYEKERTKREHWQRLDANAKERVQKMGTTKSDAATQKKQQWLQGQQINIYKTFATKMAALTAKQQFLTPSAFKLAEQQLRVEHAKAIKLTNDIGRAEGFQITPDMEAMEHPEADPFGPSTAPTSEEENKSFLDGLVNSWKHMFGGAPGHNAGVVAPPQGPTGGGGWSAR